MPSSRWNNDAPNVVLVDLAELAGEIAGAMAARARSAEVEIIADVAPRTIHADPDLIRRVLENLVDNAIRHAPAETQVRISSVTRSTAVELRVADAGPGVPPPCATACSSASSRATPARAAAAVWAWRFCKLAIEAQGGAIWIEDASPGAVFCIRLDTTA